jgi:hypothetical protein
MTADNVVDSSATPHGRVAPEEDRSYGLVLGGSDLEVSTYLADGVRFIWPSYFW